MATGVGEVGSGVVSFGGALGGAGDLDGLRTNRFVRSLSFFTRKGGSGDEEIEGEVGASGGGGFGRAAVA